MDCLRLGGHHGNAEIHIYNNVQSLPTCIAWFASLKSEVASSYNFLLIVIMEMLKYRCVLTFMCCNNNYRLQV